MLYASVVGVPLSKLHICSVTDLNAEFALQNHWGKFGFFVRAVCTYRCRSPPAFNRFSKKFD